MATETAVAASRYLSLGAFVLLGKDEKESPWRVFSRLSYHPLVVIQAAVAVVSLI
jgi:hypothetical protein